MQLDSERPLHLTYCTNIHPGNGWAEVFANVARFAPALKRRFSPDAPFGIGLRLSARDARELLDGRLDDFAAFLQREGLYVSLINGFPHGAFHRTPVKAQVYAPDWRDPERVRYTLDLVSILERLAPRRAGAGVSTAPLSYKAWMDTDDEDGWRRIVDHVVQVVEAMARVRETSGLRVHLDIEPEPDCTLENTDETLAFFARRLLPQGSATLAARLGTTRDRGEALIREHVQVCFDCCHVAVEYEDPLAALRRFADAGIRIGRVQLSSAIRVALPGAPEARQAALARLRPFNDPVYLHQVVERRSAGALAPFPDLDDAFAGAHADGREWRVHFHVPLFARDYDGLGSTQDDVAAVLRAARERRFTEHLEIETYTWAVLPAGLKVDLLESIAREYDWVLGHLRP